MEAISLFKIHPVYHCHPTPLWQSPQRFVSKRQKIYALEFTVGCCNRCLCDNGARYTFILKSFGCCGVAVLHGRVRFCKSEGYKCALSIFGAQTTHVLNSQTTPFYLFKAASKTIPIIVGDDTERLQTHGKG